MDSTEGLKNAIKQLRKDADDMLKRLHSEVKASKEARQGRKAEQRPQQ